MQPPPKVNANGVYAAFSMLYCALSYSANETTKTWEGRVVKFILGGAQPISEVAKVFSKNIEKLAQLGSHRSLRDMLTTIYYEVVRIYDNAESKRNLLELIDRILSSHFATLMLEDIENQLPQEFKLKRDTHGSFTNPAEQLSKLRTTIDPRPEKDPPLVTSEQYISMARLIIDHELSQLRVHYPEWSHPARRQETLHAPFTRIIPSLIVHYENLKTLTFNNSQIDFLPPYLEKLTKLETLDLRHTEITTSQDVIYHLRALKKLAAYFYPDLALLPQLTVLDLSNVISDSLPDFSHTQGLERLRMTNCQLTRLLPTLILLTQLKFLDLSDNFIEDVVKLQHLPQLEELFLSNNKQIISEIPIGNSLKKLTCDRDHLPFITFPADPLDHLQLEHIGCPGNQPLSWNKTPNDPTLSEFLAAHRKTPEKLA